MQRGLQIAGLLLILTACDGCGKQDDGKRHDSPAGHPDELRDSTRFDAAGDTARTHRTAQDSTPDSKRRLRFR